MTVKNVAFPLEALATFSTFTLRKNIWWSSKDCKPPNSCQTSHGYELKHGKNRIKKNVKVKNEVEVLVSTVSFQVRSIETFW